MPKEIEKLLKEERNHLTKINFTIFDGAAEFNYNLLANSGFDQETLVKSRNTCCISYGSELKQIKILDNLLRKHPIWEILKDNISRGCEYPVKIKVEEVRLLDLRETLN